MILTAFNRIKHVTKIKCTNVPRSIEFKIAKGSERSSYRLHDAVIDYTLHVTSCYVGANQRGRWGNKTGQKMSKFKGRERKAKEAVKDAKALCSHNNRG